MDDIRINNAIDTVLRNIMKKLLWKRRNDRDRVLRFL